jgi:transcription termination factor Rho
VINSHTARAPETIVNRPDFEKLIPIFPDERITLETTQQINSTRILDIFAPVGQRAGADHRRCAKSGENNSFKKIANAIN